MFLFYATNNNDNGDVNNGVNAIALQRRSSIILQRKLNDVLLQTDDIGSDDVQQLLAPDTFACCVKICNDHQGNRE